MKKFFALLAPLLVLFFPTISKADPILANLQDCSVTVHTHSAEGSGVTILRKNAQGQESCFVLTAAHVVEDLRLEQDVVQLDGSHKTVVRFADAMVLRRVVEDGREVSWIVASAQVIRYSNANTGEDIAILRVRQKGFGKASAKFDLDDSIPEVGTDLLHVGSFLGQFGAGSYSVGNLSRIGVVFESTVFDQTSVVAFPGSSGGGVYLKDGRYIGMLVRVTGPSFNYIVPVRRIRNWASSTQLTWLLDDKVTFEDVTLQVRTNLGVEDPGTNMPVDGAREHAHFLIKSLD